MKIQEEKEMKEARTHMLFRSEGGEEGVGDEEGGEEGEVQVEVEEEDREEGHREETEGEKEESTPEHNKGTKRTNHQISTDSNVSPVLFFLWTLATTGEH